MSSTVFAPGLQRRKTCMDQMCRGRLDFNDVRTVAMVFDRHVGTGRGAVQGRFSRLA